MGRLLLFLYIICLFTVILTAAAKAETSGSPKNSTHSLEAFYIQELDRLSEEKLSEKGEVQFRRLFHEFLHCECLTEDGVEALFRSWDRQPQVIEELLLDLAQGRVFQDEQIYPPYMTKPELMSVMEKLVVERLLLLRPNFPQSEIIMDLALNMDWILSTTLSNAFLEFANKLEGPSKEYVFIRLITRLEQLAKLAKQPIESLVKDLQETNPELYKIIRQPYIRYRISHDHELHRAYQNLQTKKQLEYIITFGLESGDNDTQDMALRHLQEYSKNRKQLGSTAPPQWPMSLKFVWDFDRVSKSLPGNETVQRIKFQLLEDLIRLNLCSNTLH